MADKQELMRKYFQDILQGDKFVEPQQPAAPAGPFVMMTPEMMAQKGGVTPANPAGDEVAGPPNLDQAALTAYLDRLREQENPFSSQRTKEAVSKYQSTKEDEINFTPYAALMDKWSGKGTGSQLTTAAKSLLDKDTLNKDLVREEARNSRQDKAQGFQLSKDFNNDLRKDVKNLEETLRIANPVREALTPDANGRVNVQRVQAAITNAGRLLGNIGVQTENDAARTQMQTLSLMLGTLEAKFLNDPTATIDSGQVANLLNAIESAVAGQQDAAAAKVKLTRDAYVVGRGLDGGQADAVESLYQDLAKRASGDRSQVSSSAPAEESEDAAVQRINALRAKKKSK